MIKNDCKYIYIYIYIYTFIHTCVYIYITSIILHQLTSLIKKVSLNKWAVLPLVIVWDIFLVLIVFGFFSGNWEY